MFNKLHINVLVNLSFFAIVVLFTILMIASDVQLSKIKADSIRVTSLRAPTVKASASINTALNRSLAALRGWMLIEEEQFLIDRRDSWQTIRQDEIKLKALSQGWTNPENLKRLTEVTQLLDQLENEQLNIELLAHKVENIPSSKILFNSAAPLATLIATNITKMIDFTKTQKSSSHRLKLLAAMADFRGSFALSLADIRAFLLSGESKFKISFEGHWKKNEESYKRLNLLAKYASPFERGLLNEIKVLRDTFIPLPEKMFSSRLGSDWNQSNYLLKTTAVKTANNLVILLQEMVNNQNFLLDEDAQLLSENIEQLEIFQLIFLSLVLLITLFFGIIINNKYRAFRRKLNSRNTLVDQNVLMATLNGDGAITNISNALCRLLGGVKHDFVGEKSHFFLRMDNDSELHETILKSLMTGQIWQGEFKRDSLKGEEIWLSSTIFPISNEGEGEGEGYYNILEDITDRKLFEEVSITDKLTSLHNRRKYDEAIDQEIKLARRRETYLTLAIVDIDYFKKYNDHYGHPVGDTALVRTASVLRSSLSRPDDYVFRLGGEEFAIIFNSLDEKQSWDMLEQIRKNVEYLKIEHSHNEVSDCITISIGAKICGTDELMEKDVFYNEADRLLYTAKQTRNTVVVG